MANFAIKLALFSFLIHASLSTCANGTDTLCRFCFGGVCGLCSAAFVNTNTSVCQRPTTTVDNCIAYLSDGVCSGCRDGYRTNGNGCISIGLKNCAAVDPTDSTRCIYCNDGTLVNVNGTCDGATKCNINNCKYCSRNGNSNSTTDNTAQTCSVCNSGYVNFPSNGTTTCLAESGATNNCYLAGFNINGTVSGCATCDYGYYINNGSCSASQNVPYSAASILGVLAASLFALMF